MRDHLAVLCCDAADCRAEIAGPASQLTARAEAAGWQVTAPTSASADEDDVDLVTVDRCPHHPAEALDPATSDRDLGLPPGILARMITHRRNLS